jgi:WD40 repeat protein
MGGFDLGPTRREPAKIWDRTSHRLEVFKVTGIGPVAFAANGTPVQVVVDASNPLALQLWEVDSQTLRNKFELPPSQFPQPGAGAHIREIELSEDGAILVAVIELSATKDLLSVWDTKSGRQLFHRPLNRSTVALSPDNKLLLAGQDDGSIAIWAVPSGERLGLLPGAGLPVERLAYHRDPRRRLAGGEARRGPGGLLAAGYSGGGLTIWDLHTLLPRTICNMGSDHFYGLAWSPDGTTLVVANVNQAQIRDAASGQLLLNINVGEQITSVSMSPDGSRLATSCLRSSPGVRVWELENGRGIRTLRGLMSGIQKLKFSSDDRSLVGLANNWQVAIWNAHSGQLRHLLDVPRGYWTDNTGMAFSADGRRFAYASGTQARVWDLESGAEPQVWDNIPPGLGDTLAFDANGRLLLCHIETKDGKIAPTDQAPRALHKRVCRTWLLRPGNRLELLWENGEFDWHIWGIRAPASGEYFVVEGAAGLGGKRRSAAAFDGLTGKKLWAPEWMPRLSDAGLIQSLDTSGKRLWLFPSDGKPLLAPIVVELPSGRLLESAPTNGGVLGQRYVAAGTRTGLGIDLLGQPAKNHLVHLAMDAYQIGAVLNRSESHLAWANTDGSISLCDLEEVHRRLTELGLGW